MNDELAMILKDLGDALGQQQALNLRNSYILQELVRDVANSKPDPLRYVAQMFDRVSARADQGAIEQELHPARAEFREATDRFFEQAGRPFRQG